ncbi:ribonuclease H-like domain-containing protein [Fomitopsis serialis]|uniref:ribonuclease H-like domain-containing protein n=1 Tax=Fomitopsis serialis TaxID=139415 RepID=UPI0020073383|nr:ribonuclease H-like domain-containing protein [Neoantrodia serialis]KAH9916915.1 ribonuclease H-like domain-containing protein [Neoantrodia serialis]
MVGRVAHDHSSKLISSFKLPQPLVVNVIYTDEDEDEDKKKPKEFALTIKFIQDIETQSLVNYLEGQKQYRGYDVLPVIAALNLILAAHPNRVGGGGVMVGKNKFFHPSPAHPPTSLGGGLEAWRGFYSSVRPAYKQLMVNVNVCTTAFYTPGNLADKMQEFFNASFGARYAAFVKGVRVKTTHLGYTKTVKTAAKVNARQHKFNADDYGEVSVEQYFQRKYNIKLRYPELPLIDVGGKKQNLLPAEVCTILERQPFRGKLLDDHVAAMITVALQPPNVNARAITERGLDELGFRQGPNPLAEFGVSIGTEMAVVPGRILQPPMLQYGQGAPRVDDRASWNLRDVKFAVGGRLEKWAVLVIQDGNQRDEFANEHDPELRSVVQGFMAMCRKSGMQVGRDEPAYAAVPLPRKDPADPIRKKAIGAIRTRLMSISPKPSMVLVILSNGDKHVYSGIKHLCDVYLDVPTIRKEKGQVQYYANVALKVNMKMGGSPTMLVGMDVTHPGFGTVKGTPSIAAVVGSVDKQYGQFPATLRIQESKKEMITDLAAMMEERLNAFKAKNRILPERILVYRDGVSEGQFAIVVAEEMPEIKKSFQKFSTPQKAYSPKLTIVICGKRHHTRFYPTEAQHADQLGNPKAGTVVDRGVTAVYDFDFFLQAHGGLQGTTRPTHYYVVHDEIGFSADALQRLTNDVSYMFARATKAVSLVSPAYYADLACERGRCYLHALLQGHSDSGTTATSTSGDDEVYREAEKMWHGGVKGKLKDTMFYI